MLTSARIHLQNERWAEAAAELSEAVARDSTDADAWLLLGRAQGGLGDAAAAHEAFQRAVRLDPSTASEAAQWRRSLWVEAYNRGVTAVQAEDFEAAAAGFEAATILDGQSPESHRALGDVYQRLGRRDEALTAYRAAAALRPDDTQTQKAIGYVLYNLGDYAATADQLRAVAARDSADTDVRYYLAVAYQQLERYDEARATLAGALALAPNDVRLLADLGRVCYHLQDYEAAAVAYEALLAAAVDDEAVSRQDLAKTYFQLERPAEARMQLERAVALDDGLGEAWYLLGVLNARDGQSAASESAFARARALGVE